MPAEAPNGDANHAIAGVTLVVYASVTAHAYASGMSALDAAALATSHGVTFEAWELARRGWRERISESEEVRAAYAAPYAGARS